MPREKDHFRVKTHRAARIGTLQKSPKSLQKNCQQKVRKRQTLLEMNRIRLDIGMELWVRRREKRWEGKRDRVVRVGKKQLVMVVKNFAKWGFEFLQRERRAPKGCVFTNVLWRIFCTIQNLNWASSLGDRCQNWPFLAFWLRKTKSRCAKSDEVQKNW